MQNTTAIFAFFATCSLAVASIAKPNTAPLPLKRVRLYETGVAYLERSGVVAGRAQLPVPDGHLDDALKTLVVLSADGKTQVRALHFPSRVSAELSRAVAGISDESANATGLHALLTSLVGADVELKAGKLTTRGRLMSVLGENASDLKECGPGKDGTTACHVVPSAVFLADSGELRRLPVREIDSVRPLDTARVQRLKAASSALGSGPNDQKKGIEIDARGQQLTLGYVTEAPVWRSTYRLVLGDKRSVLQGWALVHNDSDEAWKQVQLELVNGQPDSFLFPLAAPRYARRELVTPDEELSTVPQLLGGTTDGLWGDEIGESFGAGGLGLSGVGQGGGGHGQGIGLGSVGTVGHGGGVGSGDAASSILDVGNLAAVSVQEGVEAGAQFTYSVKGAVDLSARSSALLPFVQHDVKAQRISLFQRPGQSARSAVRLQNETGQTLPAGTLAVFAGGGLAGESALLRMKPKEVLFVSFGLDMDVSAELEARGAVRDETRYVSFAGNVLREHFVRQRSERFALENRSGAPRLVYVGMDVVRNATVSGAKAMDYDPQTQRAHAVFDSPPRSKRSPTLTIREGLSRGHQLKDINSRRLRGMLASKAIPEAQRGALSRAADALHQAEIRRGARSKRARELAVLQRDARRLREHARALSGANSADIVARLLRIEDKIDKTRTRISELDAGARENREKARAILRGLPRR